MGRWARDRAVPRRSGGRFRGARPRGGCCLLALVLDGALEVHLALLALAHELLQAGLEVRVGTAALARGRGVLQRLDREVDLAVLLDGDDLRLDDVVLAKMLVDVLDVVPVDLGDVDEPHLAALQGQEGAVRGDAADGPVDDRADLEICQDSSSFRTSSSAVSFLSGASPGRQSPIGAFGPSMVGPSTVEAVRRVRPGLRGRWFG